MKKSLIIGLIQIIACMAIVAQETPSGQTSVSDYDLIVKENGDELKNVKVLEITLTEIKYKRASNMDGPLYSIAKSDVFMIKYANGEKDVFEIEKPAAPVKPTPAPASQNRPPAATSVAAAGQQQSAANKQTQPPATPEKKGLHEDGETFSTDGIDLIYVEGGLGGMRSFYIGKYEITQAQWEAVMGSNPSQYKGANLPLHKATYNEILDYISALNSRTGKKFRLPTEAEWLYAAKGGKKQDNYNFAGSNDPKAVAVFGTKKPKGPREGGTKQPNALGIFDMSGNVWEWMDTGKLRGGCWSSLPKIGTMTGKYSPKTKDERFGFRIVMNE